MLNTHKMRKNTQHDAEQQVAEHQDDKDNDTEQHDAEDKEVLGLDESGQIKLSHGTDEIKEMMDKGMVKTYGKRE